MQHPNVPTYPNNQQYHHIEQGQMHIPQRQPSTEQN